MSRYAEGTRVDIPQSIEDIRRAVIREGGKSFSHQVIDDVGGRIVFSIRDVWVRFEVKYPALEDFTYIRMTGGGRRKRDNDQRYAAWTAEQRRLWRVLLLQVKTKLEVSSEISEREFTAEWLGYIMLGNGQTVAENVSPQLPSQLLTANPTKLLT